MAKLGQLAPLEPKEAGLTQKHMSQEQSEGSRKKTQGSFIKEGSYVKRFHTSKSQMIPGQAQLRSLHPFSDTHFLCQICN